MDGSDRRRLSALVAVLAAVCVASGKVGHAVAQDAAAVDPFEEGVVYVEADEVIEDGENNRYIARGNVEARYGPRTVRADEVIYFPQTERVVARGSVVVLEDNGVATFADEVELAADLTEGLAEDFSVRLPNRGTIGAAFAVRRSEERTEFTRAFYTACEVCEEEGSDALPTWRLRARRVVQDRGDEVIYYRDAVLEVLGVPVLYTPYFSHADPSVGRRTGFLLPTLSESDVSGTAYEQPFFWAINDSTDLTIAPRLMTNVNPLVSWEARRRFFSGAVTLQGSATYERLVDRDGEVDLDSDETWRSHIFGEGVFRINNDWIWGFGLERVSEDLYFERYEIDDSDQQRGLYSRGGRRYLSQLYALGQDDDYYISAAALAFQDTRRLSAGEALPGQDRNDITPTVLPLIEARATFAEPITGGRVEARASSAFITRSSGADSRRVSAELDWRRPTVFGNGIVATPFALARADIYDVAEFARFDENGVLIETVDETFARALGYLGLDASMPFGRRAGPASIVIEPVASLVLAPDDGNDERIPNEDSVVFDFDQSVLFDPNRSPGYDVWEDGARVTVGGRALVQWNGGGEASVFLGQSYRFDETDVFPEISGLAGDNSDVAGSLTFALNARNRVSASFRLDDEDLDIQRLDLSARAGLGPLSANARYLSFEEELNSGRPREELTLAGTFRFTDNFSAFYSLVRDLSPAASDEDFIDRFAAAGFVYTDNCTQVRLVYERENRDLETFGPSESLRLQFTLATLGTFGQN